jgi:hypothetical protein
MKCLHCAAMGALVILTASSVSAEAWKLTSEANVTLTQSTYSDNWVGGEAGALSWTLNSNSRVEKLIGASVNTMNTLRLSFGQTHNQDVETKNWSKPVKSTDLIDFESVFRFLVSTIVDPYVSLRVESQFLDASDPLKGRYVNPLKFTEAAGIARMFIEEENRMLMARLGGGLRQFVNRDELNIDTIARETLTSNDAGLTFDGEYKSPFADNKLTFASKLTVFWALYYSEADALEGQPEEDYWKAPDVNWENILTANITEHLMVNLYVQLLYDKQIDLKGRFKQTLSLGITYNFI